MLSGVCLKSIVSNPVFPLPVGHGLSAAAHAVGGVRGASQNVLRLLQPRRYRVQLALQKAKNLAGCFGVLRVHDRNTMQNALRMVRKLLSQ